MSFVRMCISSIIKLQEQEVKSDHTKCFCVLFSRGSLAVGTFRRIMKEINTFQLVKVPEGVEATVKARTVTVKGPRGSLTKAFKHLSVDIYKV